MNRINRLRGLLAALLTIGLAAAPGSAQGLRLRSRAQLDQALAQTMVAGSDRVKVIVVARESRASLGLMADGAVHSRRTRADASTQAIRELLTEGDEATALALGVSAHAGGRAARQTYLWACNAVATEVDAATLERLQHEPSVERIVLDRQVQWIRKQPVQVLMESEPSLYGLPRIGVPAARARGLTGHGVVVGLIDTGVQADHPELAGKVLAFKDFVDGKTEAYDDEGHGTHCAGTIAGTRVGVAPGARLLVAKAMGGQGGGSLSGLLEAMQWMLDPDGDPSTHDQPALVSNSWGANVEALGDSVEVFRDMVKAWRDAGIVPVFASGNDGPDTAAVPGGYPESFAVGATDEDDQDADFSTGGPVVIGGETFLKPDVSAPGVAIVSSIPGGKYAVMDGTSMACPHVAGAMAVAFEAAPGTSVDQMEAAFVAGAVDLGAPGKDARFGEGRIDIPGTLAALGRGLPL